MIRTVAVMGTIVTIQMVADARDSHIIDRGDPEEAVERALDWFRRVEACCSRFDPHSELMQLSAQIGLAVPVSEMLYEVVQFALAVAEETAGAFDPTVGREMETRGFNREHRTRNIVRTPLEPGGDACYRDVALDPDHQTITLLRPLILDLGAVAKGFAIDMAARELRPFEDFAINAGGDLYLGGRSPAGTPWSIGIRHPRRDRHLIASVRASDAAVCTSGDYERTTADARGHHILDPRSGAPSTAVASVTVVAPTAMAADALATAAFVLGPHEGIRLLERQGVEGLIVTPALERYETRGMASVYACGG
jgi:thiamine biosynthesis lipoprotein